MSSEALITLPVSLAEALDKLTILDIKLQKITDNRKIDVQKEYDILYEALSKYTDSFPYHYRILKDINQTIWNILDIFHDKNITQERSASYGLDILLENDRRFRVKSKINTLAASALKEQKGYALKKAFVYTHLGLGDMFWMNGAVRYLATAYDEVLVVCKERNIQNALAMYADDPSIKLLAVKDDDTLHPWVSKRTFFEGSGYTVYSCGFFANKENTEIYELPFSFYDDMGIPRDIRTRYFHVPRTEEASSLVEAFKGRAYIVVHQQSSVKKLDIVGSLRKKGETRLILDLNENHYKEADDDYAIAQLVVNKPLLDYTYLIEGAVELHMIESSIYCMTNHLDLSRVSKMICYEPWEGNADHLGLFTTGSSSSL